MSTARVEDEVRRLRRATRALDDPPSPPGWNLAELADVLDPSIPRRSAAVLVPIVLHIAATGAKIAIAILAVVALVMLFAESKRESA